MNSKSAVLGMMSAALALAATPAQAETLSVSAYLPADTDAGLPIEAIAVDDIGGAKGAQLGFELKKALERVRVTGEQWFEIVPLGAAPVDVVIQGSASIQSAVIDLEPKRERKCVEKNDDKKCIRYRTNVYECSRTEVSFYPDIEIVGREGELIYTARNEISRSKEVCADVGSRPSISGMSDALVSNFAWRVRNALAPRFLERDYRILERRKGLAKDDRKAFKQAVKLTKTDENAACDAFKALEANNPQHVSVLFNVAMCHERDGAYEESLATLERALAVEPKKVVALESVDRVDGWLRGIDQLNARAEIMHSRYPELADASEGASAAPADSSTDE